MKIAFVTQHAQGGVIEMMRPVCEAFKIYGHEVSHIVAGKSQIALSGYDHVHYFNLGSMQFVTTDSSTSATLHHMSHGYEQFYINLIGKCAPDKLHCIDAFAVRQLGRAGIYGVHLIPSYVTRKYTPQPLPTKFRIGYIGGDPDFKRFDIVKQIADATCVECVGHVTDANNWLTDEQVEQFYREISCYVVASYEDGGPIPPLEALQMGRPVLSTWVGQMPNWIKPPYNGLFFDGTVAHGASKLRAIIKEIDIFHKGASETVFEDKLPGHLYAAYLSMFSEAING